MSDIAIIQPDSNPDLLNPLELHKSPSQRQRTTLNPLLSFRFNCSKRRKNKLQLAVLQSAVCCIGSMSDKPFSGIHKLKPLKSNLINYTFAASRVVSFISKCATPFDSWKIFNRITKDVSSSLLLFVSLTVDSVHIPILFVTLKLGIR